MLCGGRFSLCLGFSWWCSIQFSLLFAWRNCLGNYSSNVWNMVPAYLMWLVWKECNAQTFEPLKTSLARTLFEWSRIWGLTHCISLSGFLISLRSAIWFVCILSLPCVYNRKHIAFLLSIKLLLPSQKKRITTIDRSKCERLLVRQVFVAWLTGLVMVELVVKKNKTRIFCK